MRTINRHLSLFVIICFLLAFGTACGGNAPVDTSQSNVIPSTPVSTAPSANPTEVESHESVTLQLAVCGGTILDYGLIAEFAADNPGCNVEIVDYWALCEFDYEKALQRLLTEIIGGNGPDMIDLTSFGLDLACYAEKGVFEDLYPWLETDPELSKEDFIASVRSLCEVNGGLYAVMSGFSIKTIYSKQSIAESLDSWNLENFYPYSDALGSAGLSDKESITLSGEDFLNQLCQTSIATFVDYSSGEAYFDTDAFVELLECCKPMEETTLQDPTLRLASVWDFFEIQYQEYLAGESIVYLGFPGLGNDDSGSYVNNQNNFIAMSAMSAHKEESWNFMRRCLDASYQKACYVEASGANAFPTNVHALNALAERSSEPLYAIDEDGNQVEVTSRGMYEYAYHEATKEHVEKIMELINSVSNMQCYDPVIAEIVQTEAAAYFAQDKTAEETAALIQSMVSLYLGELA